MTMITLRPVKTLDDGFLRDVYASTRADELALVPWNAEEKASFIEMQFRAQTADYEARFPGSEHSIILVDNTPVGRIWVGRWDDEIRLLDIAILTEQRNQNTGRVLIERLIEEARQSATPLRHSVSKTNEAAIRFYERLGFCVQEDFETYVLMEWTAEVASPKPD
jgi:ribosomal protein S18 acetylase RimI-like enzyme